MLSHVANFDFAWHVNYVTEFAVSDDFDNHYHSVGEEVTAFHPRGYVPKYRVYTGGHTGHPAADP